MYNHNKAQQSKNRVHISWDILYSKTESLNFLADYIFITQKNDIFITQIKNQPCAYWWPEAKWFKYVCWYFD